MNIDIFETRSPSLDTNISGFHSISNDSSLGEITSSNNILSEIKQILLGFQNKQVN